MPSILLGVEIVEKEYVLTATPSFLLGVKTVKSIAAFHHQTTILMFKALQVVVAF